MRVLLSGIPSPAIFRAERFDELSISYSTRGKDRRTIADLRDDFRVCGNTGNLLIGEGAAGALRQTNYTYLTFWQLSQLAQDPKRVRTLRASYDLLILATANIFRRVYDAAAEANTLISIGLPTYLLGAGLQGRELLNDLPAGTLDLIDFLSAAGNGVFARGEMTAEFLKKKGISNVAPVGCPSAYFMPEGVRTSIEKYRSLDLHVGGSLMVGGYIGHSSADNDIQHLQALGPLACVLQDEFIHYNMVLTEETSLNRIYNSVTGEILSSYHHPAQAPGAIRPPIHMFFNTFDWRAWARNHELYFGRRFHGGVLAMQAGVPSVFVAIDDRMREMLDHLAFPYVEKSIWESATDKISFLRDFLAGVDTENCIAAYERREAEFRQELGRLVGLSTQERSTLLDG